MMVERFASASDDIMVFIAIARDWLTFVATAYMVSRLGTLLAETGILLPDTIVWFLVTTRLPWLSLQSSQR